MMWTPNFVFVPWRGPEADGPNINISVMLGKHKLFSISEVEDPNDLLQERDMKKRAERILKARLANLLADDNASSD